MKVRMLQNLHLNGVTLPKGEVVELPQAAAMACLQRGTAQRADLPYEVESTLTEEPVEWIRVDSDVSARLLEDQGDKVVVELKRPGGDVERLTVTKAEWEELVQAAGGLDADEGKSGEAEASSDAASEPGSEATPESGSSPPGEPGPASSGEPGREADAEPGSAAAGESAEPVTEPPEDERGKPPRPRPKPIARPK